MSDRFYLNANLFSKRVFSAVTPQSQNVSCFSSATGVR